MIERQTASQHPIADTYTKHEAKNVTRKRSGSVGQCGKRESEGDRQCMQRIRVAQAVE